MTDKHRVPAAGAAGPELHVVSPNTGVDFDSITAVVVIPLLRSGEIVAIAQERGVDIPGGHI